MDAARATLAGHLKAAGLDDDTAAGIVGALAAGEADAETVLSLAPAALTPTLASAVNAVVHARNSTAAATMAPPPAVAPGAAARPPAPTTAPPPTGGGRRGGSLSIKAAKPKPSSSTDPHTAAVPRPDRPVTNCLSCGRVYDLRAAPRPGSRATITSAPPASDPTGSSPADVAALIASGGTCQACEGRVSLRRGEAVAVGGGEGGDTSAAADGLRARLVAADAAGALTSVLDDDGLSTAADIDANVWLSRAEKEELKAEVAAAQSAATERRRVTRVTLDLAGRRVVVEENAAGGVGVGVGVPGVPPAPPAPPRHATFSSDVITALTAALAPWRLDDGGDSARAAAGEEGGGAAALVGTCPDLPVPRPIFGLPVRVETQADGRHYDKEEEPGAFVPGYAPPSDEEGKGGGGGRRKRGGKGS